MKNQSLKRRVIYIPLLWLLCWLSKIIKKQQNIPTDQQNFSKKYLNKNNNLNNNIINIDLNNNNSSSNNI